jgi:hypothetical protein
MVGVMVTISGLSRSYFSPRALVVMSTFGWSSMLPSKLEYDVDGQGGSDIQTSEKLSLIYERDGEVEKSTWLANHERTPCYES